LDFANSGAEFRFKNLVGRLQKYVLTAMHCVFEHMASPQNFVVIAGLHDICTNSDTPFQKRSIQVS
jgi:secreted trypsin-like serine protease